MNLKVINILVSHYVGKKNQYIYFIVISLLGTLVSLFPIDWDFTGKSVRFFGFPLDVYSLSREESLLDLLSGLFSWMWVIITIFFLPRLMKRLNDSFSVNEMLWLRLVQCSPYEVATARVLWVMTWVVLLSIFGGLWAYMCALFHEIPIRYLLINVEGLLSHILLSGGIIVVLNSIVSAGESEKNLISVIALFFPILLTFIYLGIRTTSNINYMQFFPYVAPFNRGLQNTAIHFGMAALIGTILLFLNAVFSFRNAHVRINLED